MVVTAALWRGAMIERFARIEFFVDRALEACAAAGLIARSHASDHFPIKRIEQLLVALADERLAGRGATAIAVLKSVKDGWETRNGLCHGRMRIRRGCIRLEWTCYRNQARTPQSKTFTWLDMLSALQSLDDRQRQLGSALGIVEKACRA